MWTGCCCPRTLSQTTSFLGPSLSGVTAVASGRHWRRTPRRTRGSLSGTVMLTATSSLWPSTTQRYGVMVGKQLSHWKPIDFQTTLTQRQRNIFKVALYYEPNDFIITKVKKHIFKLTIIFTVSLFRSQGVPECPSQTRSPGWAA